MANVINKATNKFTKGLVMDFSPENTRNDVLTHALNATLLTFNGNELSLQNDMGNARVETAFLPEGYIPVGTCEYGGIIYIVSYNPLEDKSQIGCFPSPERNISNDELGISDAIIPKDSFQEYSYDNSGIPISPTGKINNTSQYVLLKNNKLNPGDKFLISADEEIYTEKLQDLYIKSNDEFKHIENPILKLNVVSIEDDGKIIYLNNSVKQYEKNLNEKNYKYHILGEGKNNNFDQTKVDIDFYRNILTSGYNVFKSKTSGKLAILAELLMIDSYSVTHELKPNINDIGEKYYDVIIHNEISPIPTENDFNLIPKLKYYYLEESNGYIQYQNTSRSTNNKNFEIKLSDIFISNNQEWNNSIKNISINKSYFDYKEKNNYFTPSNNNEFLITKDTFEYEDIDLAKIIIPKEVTNNKLIYPFKYDYTLVPCMSYGKLDHLAVSNTIDFSKVNDFNNSQFNIWKYRIDGDQLRLTFGTEIYDQDEQYKVQGLVLEFYDHLGFAGSLEISDKKSYSGIFTKIINLNTLQELSRKKIINNNSQNSNYVHNTNIFKEKDKNNKYVYKLDNYILTHDYNKGWSVNSSIENPGLSSGGNTVIIQPSTPNTRSTSMNVSIVNDCGTLYSNRIYGVKTYFKKAISKDEIKFILKDQFFLYTFPIFNDQYYTVNNFKGLNPKLKFLLTYKLSDFSIQEDFEFGGFFKKGYCHVNNESGNSDFNNINKYLSGNYSETSLNITKYYKYTGNTDLFLEIGLHKDYEQMNLSYSSDINKYFTCSLKLIGNKNIEESFNVNSDYDDYYNYLNYPNFFEDSDKSFIKNQNKLNFENNTHDFEISNNFNKYNFITNSSVESIKINYSFVVGYKINIIDIVKSSINTTVICALCHKRDDGTYNYEDFGIYYNPEKNLYLSEKAFYNYGTYESSTFGICKQNNIYKSQVDEGIVQNAEYYFQIINSYTTNKVNCNHKQLNTTLLPNIINQIGKLTFCQPHVHQIDPNYGVNVYKGKNNSTNKDVFAINRSNDSLEDGDFSFGDGNHDTTDGIAPTRVLYDYPAYTLSINTYSSIINQNEFISAIEFDNTWENNNYEIDTKFYDLIDSSGKDKRFDATVPMKFLRLFKGFGPNVLENFNKCLLTSMKNIYAYNPDYDTINIYKGTVSIEKYNPQFISNIISYNANLNLPSDKTLNDYIYFGSMKISDYLSNLNIYSSFEENTRINIDSIEFKYDLEYCGASNYLITSLTYNTPVSDKLIDELEFNNTCFIKKHDGTLESFSTIPNKKLLYGYVNKKLIQLDVSNYQIDSDGNLIITNEDLLSQDINYFNITSIYSNIDNIGQYKILDDYKKSVFVNSSITINDLIYYPNESHRLFLKSDKYWYAGNNGTINYRKIEDFNTVNPDEWDQKYATNNRLYLYSGPCITETIF